MEASEKLRDELDTIENMNTKEFGFTASPLGQDLFHWHVTLFGFGSETKLGQELTEWALKHTQISDFTANLEQDILLEMKFPPDFPENAPLFRIIRPRFKNIEMDLIVGEMNEGRKSMTVSRALEKSQGSWKTNTSVVDLIQQLRTFLLENNATIDMDSGSEGYALPTVGGFWRSYSAISPKTFGKTELENGGKIILPSSALEELSQVPLYLLKCDSIIKYQKG